MNAEIINIGDEILIGQINNTNSQWIAKQLNNIGVEVKHIAVISDDAQDIKNTLQQAQANIIVVTGGLGPTLDDLTKQTITEFFNDKLVFHPEIEQHIKKMFARMNYPYTLNNKGQSYLPSKAKILWNEHGTAPGMWIENHNRIFIFMPGVPFEMKAIFSNEVLPKLKSKFNLPVLYKKTVTVFGIGESLLADRINNWEKNLPENIKLAYLPHPGRIRLRLSSKGKNKENLKQEIENQIVKLKNVIPDLTVSEEVEDLVYAVHNKLTETKQTIAFAESCTGGRLVSDLAQIAGASAFLMGGIVAYNTSVKINVLKVDNNIIDKYSVVSEEVAKQMAINVRKIMKSDIGVAITGNAGPTKGDSDAEVGTCIIAISYSDDVKVFKFNFGQPREKVINRAVSKVFELIFNIIKI